MKKVIAIASLFAFILATGSAQAMSSAAGSDSSSGSSGSGHASRAAAPVASDSDNVSTGTPVDNDVVTPSTGDTGRDPVPSPIKPCAPIGEPVSEAAAIAINPCGTPDPVPTPITPCAPVSESTAVAIDPCTPKPTPIKPCAPISKLTAVAKPCPAPVPAPCTRVSCVVPPVGGGRGGNGNGHNTGTQTRPLTIAVVQNLPYGDATLLRDKSTKRIYLVVDTSLRPVRSAAELQMFKGLRQVNVSSEVIGLYKLDMSKHVYFKNGTLARNTTTYKVYVADKGRLKTVTMAQLKKQYKGKTIQNVSPAVIANY